MLRDGHPALSVASLLYFGILAATILIRLFDIEFFDGTTLGGRPVTVGYWRGYALYTVFAALLAWCGVQYVLWSERTLSEPEVEAIDYPR